MITLSYFLNALLSGIGVFVVGLFVFVPISRFSKQLLKHKYYTKLFGWLPAKPFHCSYCMTYWMSVISVTLLTYWFISSFISWALGVTLFTLMYIKGQIGRYFDED